MGYFIGNRKKNKHKRTIEDSKEYDKEEEVDTGKKPAKRSNVEDSIYGDIGDYVPSRSSHRERRRDHHRESKSSKHNNSYFDKQDHRYLLPLTYKRDCFYCNILQGVCGQCRAIIQGEQIS